MIEPMTETDKLMERSQRMVTRLATLTNIKWTFGYIGNLTYSGHDDRLWYAFAPHPGRVGTAADRIGGVSTDELGSLIPLLAGAIQLATALNRQNKLPGET